MTTLRCQAMPMTAMRCPGSLFASAMPSELACVSHLTGATHGKKIAIIENEFGDTAIDDKLIKKNSKFSTDEDIVEVLNGCMCCSVRQDLVAVLEKLAARTAKGELGLGLG